MSEIIQEIHPINANHILNTEPHRLYLDRYGSILEIVAQRFSSLVVEQLYEHGETILIGYYDGATERHEFQDTYFLRRDWRIFPLTKENQLLQNGWIDIDTYHMLLNPISINGWIPEKRKEVAQELRESKKTIDIQKMFLQARHQYLSIIQGK